MEIPQDKLIHFLGGFAVSAALGLIGAPLPGLAVGVAIGVGKEVFDRYHPPHQCELLDAASTIAGAVLAFSIPFLKEAL